MAIVMGELTTLAQYSIPFVLLTANGANSVGTVSEMGSIAKLIQDYGITTMCCVLLIIFSIVMFRNMSSRADKIDSDLMNDFSKAVSSIKTIMDSNTNAAGCFDKLNMRTTLEFEMVKSKLNEILKILEHSEKENKALVEEVDELKAHCEKLQKTVDRQMSIITQIQQSTNQQNSGNKNTMSRY